MARPHLPTVEHLIANSARSDRDLSSILLRQRTVRAPLQHPLRRRGGGGRQASSVPLLKSLLCALVMRDRLWVATDAVAHEVAAS